MKSLVKPQFPLYWLFQKPISIWQAYGIHLLWMFSYKHNAEDDSQSISLLEKNNLLWRTLYWFHTNFSNKKIGCFKPDSIFLIITSLQQAKCSEETTESSCINLSYWRHIQIIKQNLWGIADTFIPYLINLAGVTVFTNP